MTTALLVRQAVRRDRADDVAPFVVDHACDSTARGTSALLPQGDVRTAAIFLERGEYGPALWWYVELAGGAADSWSDPGDEIERSPLFAAGLADLLDPDRPARAFGPDRFDSLLVVHARHPDRPATYRTGADGLAESDGEWSPAVVLADDGPANVPDVVFVRWRLRPGPATWFMHGFARFANWVDEEGWLERKLTEWSEPVLEEEEMWTETIFLERGTGGGPPAEDGHRSGRSREPRTAVLGVMETAEMEGVTDGFYRTDNPVARVSERVLGWIVENPAQALQYEALQTDFEPLVHAVDPGRA